MAEVKTIGLAIPCYNYHIPKLKNLLDNLEKQTKIPNQVVVSCSSTSLDEINFNTSKYPFPLEFIINKDRKNAAENRNIAASRLKTDFITFFDADDVMHPQRIEIIYNCFINYKTNVILHNFIDEESSTKYVNNDTDFKNINSIVCLQNKLIQAPSGCAIVSINPKLMIHHSQVSIIKEVFDFIKFREEKAYERKEDSIFCGDVLNSELGKKNIYIFNPLSKYYPENLWFS
jgi:glycosyltransferase involved in cell wall biosynthesis